MDNKKINNYKVFDRGEKMIDGFSIREIRYVGDKLFIHTYEGRRFSALLKKDINQYTDKELIEIIK